MLWTKCSIFLSFPSRPTAVWSPSPPELGTAFFFLNRHYLLQDFCYIYFFWKNQQAIEVHWGQLSRSSTLPISTPRPQTHYILLTQPSLRHLVGSTAEGFVFLCWASCSGEQGSDTGPRPQAKKANNKCSPGVSPRRVQWNRSLD